MLGDDWDGRWASAPAWDFRASELIPTQWPHYHPCKLAAARLSRPSPDLPRFIIWDSQVFIWDGHHRVAAALKAGREYVTARYRVYRESA
jgi:hypothetical protein